MSEQIKGLAGSAVPIDKSHAPHPEAGIAIWLMHIPGPSPAWHHYALSIITLQDYPDIPKATLNYPEAEFEVMVMAVDSSKNPQPDDLKSISFMQPVNYIEQFHGVSSEEAAMVARVLVKAFVEGKLFPEPQGVVGARKLFRKTLDLTLEIVEEERDGGDPQEKKDED